MAKTSGGRKLSPPPQWGALEAQIHHQGWALKAASYPRTGAGALSEHGLRRGPCRAEQGGSTEGDAPCSLLGPGRRAGAVELAGGARRWTSSTENPPLRRGGSGAQGRARGRFRSWPGPREARCSSAPPGPAATRHLGPAKRGSSRAAFGEGAGACFSVPTPVCPFPGCSPHCQ